MKSIHFLFFVATFLMVQGLKASHLEQPIHLDLEARASEYSALRSDYNFTSDLDQIVAVGERNLEWLIHINSKRDKKLSFSSKETQIGYPMSEPSIYNTELIQASFDRLLSKLPKEMTDVLILGNAFTDDPPIETNTYLANGLNIDRVYQLAVRWNTMKNYIAQLADLRSDDVRGYYFLKADDQLGSEFKNWANLESKRRGELSDWLSQICANRDRDYDACAAKLSKLSSAAQLQSFFDTYFAPAEKHWNEYFAISIARDDVTWSADNPNSMTVPFQDPQDINILNFLKLNIEDEWKWMGWTLNLNFLPEAKTHVEFVPGQVPHVNAIAGSIITMDENSPLTEYNVQWTIRHEYGHTLGFEDCYIEFYDIHQRAIVSYQFDTSNLMCSRRGRLKQTHFDALKQAYFK